MRKKAKTVCGIVVDCRYVEGETKMIENREITWQSGSRVYIVAEGERAVSKYRVNPSAEKKVASFFDDAPFGVYVQLNMDTDGLIVDVKQVTA